MHNPLIYWYEKAKYIFSQGQVHFICLGSSFQFRCTTLRSGTLNMQDPNSEIHPHVDVTFPPLRAIAASQLSRDCLPRAHYRPVPFCPSVSTHSGMNLGELHCCFARPALLLVTSTNWWCEVHFGWFMCLVQLAPIIKTQMRPIFGVRLFFIWILFLLNLYCFLSHPTVWLISSLCLYFSYIWIHFSV
jgi:hypothetical protein